MVWYMCTNSTMVPMVLPYHGTDGTRASELASSTSVCHIATSWYHWYCKIYHWYAMVPVVPQLVCRYWYLVPWYLWYAATAMVCPVEEEKKKNTILPLPLVWYVHVYHWYSTTGTYHGTIRTVVPWY
jgi:hypothetical protein